MLQIYADTNGIDGIGFAMTEDSLFVKKTYTEKAWITIFLHNPFGTMFIPTDINITFHNYIAGNCPNSCNTGYCDNEICYCHLSNNKIGKYCDKDLNNKSGDESDGLINTYLLVPKYGGIYFEKDMELSSTNSFMVDLNTQYVYVSPPLQMYLVVCQSDTRNLLMPFYKNTNLYDDNNDFVSLRDEILWNKNNATYKLTLTKKYVYISLFSNMGSVIEVSVRFIPVDEDEVKNGGTQNMWIMYMAIGFLGFFIIASLLVVWYKVRRNVRLRRVRVTPSDAERVRPEEMNKFNEEDFDRFFKPFGKKDLDKKMENFKQDVCSICIDNFDNGEDLRQLPLCEHIFHGKC